MPPLPQTYVSIVLKLLFSLLALILAGRRPNSTTSFCSTLSRKLTSRWRR